MKQNPFRHLILGIYGLIILLPLSLVLLTTFKTTPELYSNPIGLPAGWNIENYKRVCSSMNPSLAILKTA